jgi:hypothetical protein
MKVFVRVLGDLWGKFIISRRFNKIPWKIFDRVLQDDQGCS